MKTITLSLNENETQILINLLDLALKSGGLSASAAVYFAEKIDIEKRKLVEETVKTTVLAEVETAETIEE